MWLWMCARVARIAVRETMKMSSLTLRSSRALARYAASTMLVGRARELVVGADEALVVVEHVAAGADHVVQVLLGLGVVTQPP